MAFYANDVHPIPPDHAAHDCDDQLPLIARVGRGLKGDSWQVRLDEERDSCTETYVEGGYWDDADKSWHSEWISKNINGGELKYQYNLRPYTIPRTFTITFTYQRPGRHEWSWTTPAIPYIWSVDDNGFVEDADSIVGSGVATLFVKTVHDTKWNERLNYPIDPDTGEPFPREVFNAPLADEAWASTITFGFGGDIEVPDFDDIAKIIGITKGDIFNILQDNSVHINGVDARNLIDYIDKCDARDRKHMHDDMGFGDTRLAGDGGSLTIKKYIDSMVDGVVVVSTNEKFLKVKQTKFDHNNYQYGIKYELTPAAINPGPGIQIKNDGNGNITIINTQVGGSYKTLVEGRDFRYKWHNGWYGGKDRQEVVKADSSNEDNNINKGAHVTSKGTPKPPTIRVLASEDANGKTIAAEIAIGSPADEDGVMMTVQNINDLLDDSKFKFRHSGSIPDNPESAIMSFEFIGDYAALNDLSNLKLGDTGGSNIWNIRSTNDSITSSSASWTNCGASWSVNYGVTKNVPGDYYEFVVSAVSIADGYNGQYASPKYKDDDGNAYKHLCINPRANFSINVSIW